MSAYHDNAPAHSSLTVRKYLAKKYSHIAVPTLQPDLNPCDFFLFTKLKSVQKGTQFDDLEEMKANTTHVLKALTSSDFKSCLKVWESSWNKRVVLGWGFFRKKSLVI